MIIMVFDEGTKPTIFRSVDTIDSNTWQALYFVNLGVVNGKVDFSEISTQNEQNKYCK